MKKSVSTVYRIYKSMEGFFKDMSNRNAPIYASSVSFFFFMSLFPALMFLFSLARYFPFEAEDIILVFDSIVPDAISAPLQRFILQIYNSSKSLIPITAVATLWSANMGMMGLIRGLNGVYGVEDKRNYFVLRGMATIYTILMLMGIVASLILIGFGRSIAATLSNPYPALGRFLHHFLFFRSIIIFAVLCLIFTLIYSYLPVKNQGFMSSIPGAVFASAGWIVATLALSLYIKYFNGFSVYGNLTAVIVFLFWMYMCFTILIMGAFLNKYYKAFITSKYYHIKTRKAARKLYKKERRENKKAEKSSVEE